MTQTHRNAISGRNSLKTRRENRLPCAFAMPKLAECENAAVITPPLSHRCIVSAPQAHSAYKNHPKTTVIFGTVACATCSMTVMQLSACATVKAVFEPVENTVDGFPALKSQGFALRHKCLETVVDGFSALNKQLETTVYALPAHKKYSKTTVDTFPTLKMYPKTTVDAFSAVKKCLETTVDGFSALKMYPKTTVDGLPAFDKYPKTAVDALPAFNKHPKTTVDAFSALKEHQKTVIDGILSSGGHIRHGCLRNMLNDRAVFEQVENTAKYIITQKIKRRISI